MLAWSAPLHLNPKDTAASWSTGGKFRTVVVGIKVPNQSPGGERELHPALEGPLGIMWISGSQLGFRAPPVIYYTKGGAV